VRQKWKEALKKAQTREQRMEIDRDLRMSYHHNQHHFKSNLTQKAALMKQEQGSLQMCRQCIRDLKQRERKERGEDLKKVVRLDSEQYIYDQQEIDFINEHQTKVYISHVTVNPFLRFGIRAHHHQLTTAHCLLSAFNLFHCDFLLIHLYLLPALLALWELISLNALPQSSLFKINLHQFPDPVASTLVLSGLLGVSALWLMVKAMYFCFFRLSYQLESSLNRVQKVATTILLFTICACISCSLFNYHDPHQQELSYLCTFIAIVMMLVNSVVILNPIRRDFGTSNRQQCCSNNNLLLTGSLIVCMLTLEVHHLLIASPRQKLIFHRPFHQILAVYFAALWISVQKIPEKYVPNSPFVHKYLNSEVIKSSMLLGCLTMLFITITSTLLKAEPIGQQVVHGSGRMV
jgi:hypothetical protein